MMKIGFLISTRSDGNFNARLDPMTSPMPIVEALPERNISDFSAYGDTPLDAITHLLDYLNKPDHSEEIWMA